MPQGRLAKPELRGKRNILEVDGRNQKELAWKEAVCPQRDW